MPLFVCENCQTVDNTALGFYWPRPYTKWDKEFKNLNGKALCSCCIPNKFSDGSINENYNGEWHNKFPKQKVEDYIKDHPKAVFQNYKPT